MNLEKFKNLGLSDETLKQLEKKGFEEPTEIQEKAIPLLLADEKDIIGQAQTGTGKTAAFGLPIIDRIQPKAKKVQALILAPTRELAIQVSEELNSFKGKRKLEIVPIYGGQSFSEQLRRLKSGVDIVVGTPGRVCDHLNRHSLDISEAKYLVLDEADEMLNMGFIDEVEKILEYTNDNRRTFLFSATMPPRIKAIAENYMSDYEIINTKKKQLTTENTDQIYFEVARSDKFEALCRIIDFESEFYGLIFCRTKVMVDEVAAHLIDRGYAAEGIHGDLSQGQREKVLRKFKKQSINILVATDVAARGIDVNNLTHVINYSLPQDPESYVHRIGRTGRAGKKGIAITFISPEEYRKLAIITRVTKTNIRKEKVPDAKQIVANNKKKVLLGLDKIISLEDNEPFKELAEEMLMEKDPVEVISALIKYSLADELSLGKYRKIKEVSGNHKGTARLFITSGKKDGMSSRSLVDTVSAESGVRKSDISDVAVMESFSFMSVSFEDAEAILQQFGKKSKDKPYIQIAKDDRKPSGGRRRNSNGGGRSGGRSNPRSHSGRSGGYGRSQGSSARGGNSRGGSSRNGKRDYSKTSR